MTNTKIQKLECLTLQGYSATRAHTLLVGRQNGITTLGNTMALEERTQRESRRDLWYCAARGAKSFINEIC